MKKSMLIFLLNLILISSASAQYKVINAKDKPEKEVDKGIFYNLPAQGVGMIFCVKKNIHSPGIYAEYAETLLGINNAILTSKTTYDLSVKQVFCIPISDPNKLYYLLPEGKKKLPGLNFTPWGTLYGVNLKESEKTDFSSYENLNRSFFENQGREDGNQIASFNFVQWNLTESYDTLYKKIVTDTQTITQRIIKTDLVQKTDKQKAEEAAKKILSLRETKDYLLSGSNEVNYTTATLGLMIERLNKEETELLRYFIGFEQNAEQSFYFEIFPQDSLRYPIASFSAKEGLTSWHKDKSEETLISLELRPNKERAEVMEKTQKRIPHKLSENGFYYNVPASTQLLLYYHGSVLFQKQIKLSQFGKDFSLPIGIQHLELDAQTGELKAIEP